MWKRKISSDGQKKKKNENRIQIHLHYNAVVLKLDTLKRNEASQKRPSNSYRQGCIQMKMNSKLFATDQKASIKVDMKDAVVFKTTGYVLILKNGWDHNRF